MFKNDYAVLLNYMITNIIQWNIKCYIIFSQGFKNCKFKDHGPRNLRKRPFFACSKIFQLIMNNTTYFMLYVIEHNS